MAILAVAQFTAAHATKYHSFGFSSARVSGYLFDVRNGPDVGDQVFSVDYTGAVVLGVALPVASGGTGLTTVAAGDILYGSSSGVIAGLTVGSANDVLTSNGTIPGWTSGLLNAHIGAGAAIVASKIAAGTFGAGTYSFVGSTISAATSITSSAFVGPLTGTASLATLASTVTVVDSTDASSFIAMFDSATGSLAVKTDGGLTYSATTGLLTATGFSGPLTGDVTGNVSGSSGSTTGNAATATALETARAINTVNFDGTSDITVTAAAGTLTGTTLKSTVVTSSLTGLGTIASLVATTADINAGTFDGVVGGTTPAAGDFTTLGATGNLTVSGTGPHAIGGAVSLDFGLYVRGQAGAALVAGTRFAQDFTAQVDGSAFGLWISPTITEAASGTHPVIATLTLSEPAIVGAGAATTIATTLYIASAPTFGGSFNNAIHVASGTSYFAGNVGIGQATGASSLMVTDTTINTYAMVITNSHATNPRGLNIDYSDDAPNGTGELFILCEDSAAARFFVTSNGGISNFQSNDADLSDERLKTRYDRVGSTWEQTKAIEIWNYRYTENLEGRIMRGAMAKQVGGISPHLFHEKGWGDGIHHTLFNKDLWFDNMRTLQEAQARIEKLEKKVFA